ncbi:MAG: hypothetical protein IH948_09560, partial [Bacteroidetes bacterium]|nr:hypothetical protein [Bacteroidota bacterium]
MKLISLYIMFGAIGNTFFSLTLGDFRGTSTCFISIYVQDKDFVKKIVIENVDMYIWLSGENLVNDTSEYYLFMKRMITNGDTLKMKIPRKIKGRIIWLSENEKVEKLSLKGKDFFISHYFNNNVINYELVEGLEVYNIIDVLFRY